MTPLYELEGVVRRYGERVALDVPELTIDTGEIVGLVGPNGSGKSTLLRTLAFLDAPDEGVVLFHGRPAFPASPELRRQATLLLQEPYLLKTSVFENVAYGLRLRGEKHPELRVRESLGAVGLDPDLFARRSWHALSGGEAQRVALASRLALRPAVLLLDEPTASVDAASAGAVREAILTAVRQDGTTLVVVSHDLLWLYEVASRMVGLRGGRVVPSGAENVLAGAWVMEEHGMGRLVLEDGQVVLGAHMSPGASVGILDPGEILVSRVPPEGLSARNALRGRVGQMFWENGSSRVLVRVGLGQRALTARVTTDAVRDLGIHPGQEVWLVFKAHALHWS